MQKLLAVLAILLLTSANASAEIMRELGPIVRVSPPVVNTQYNPTLIKIGNFLYLYTMGGTPGDDCEFSDKITAFRAPLDGNGHPGAFSRIGRVSPCFEPPELTVPVSYGPGQIFVATLGGQVGYHLLVDASDTLEFKRVWWGSTTDGMNWTWRVSDDWGESQVENLADPVVHTVTAIAEPNAFMHTSLSNLRLLNPITLALDSGQNGSSWWGFMNYIHAGVFKVGRFMVDWTGTTPTVRIVTSINPNGSYNFTEAVNGNVDFIPHAFIEGTGVKTLLHDPAFPGVQHLWGTRRADWSNENVGCDTSTIVECTLMRACTGPHQGKVGCPTEGDQCVEFGDSANAYNANTLFSNSGGGFVWWKVLGLFNFDPEPQLVISDSRLIPTGYTTGQIFPARWNGPGGTRFLFSVTNDDNICTRFLRTQFEKLYIVQSQIDVLENIFEDGLETGDTSSWSATCPPTCQGP